MLNSYFKYTGIATAKAVLTNQSFRFSSPLCFNDPFDIQTRMYTEFDMDDLTNVVISRIEEYVSDKKLIPYSKSDNENSILKLKRALELTGNNFNQIKADLIPLVEDVTRRIKASVSYHNNAWLKGMQRTRAFCVTETKDNLLMWAHYAQDHTGIVFEIENINSSNNILSNIEKVQYGEKPISYFTLDELLDWILFSIEPDFKKILYFTYACYKSNHWDYEHEWRVLYDTNSPELPVLYFDCKFNSVQLKSIYFGCKTSNENMVEISRMAILVNPKIELYRAEKKEGSFSLTFARI